jgi:hypothetical protein
VSAWPNLALLFGSRRNNRAMLDEMTHRHTDTVVDLLSHDSGTDSPREKTVRGRPWLELAQNRFWLIVPMLALDLALTGKLPPPLAPGSAGPDIPSWLSLSETMLRVVVLGAPLLMPLSPRAPGSRRALAVYAVGLAAYVAAWVAVVWAPASAWSTGAVGFTALAWTSIILFTGIGLGSRLRFIAWYRPWMYLAAATLFAVVHTLPVAMIWRWYY